MTTPLPPPPPLLSLSQVTAGYGEVPILRGISLTVGEGEIVALIGANGAGKTTTLMTICGIVPDISADSKIEFGGESLLRLSPDQIAARGICQSPEGRRIFPDLSVQENLEMGAYLRRDSAAAHRDLDYALSLFPILKKRRRQAGGTLSGGEQQMLAISRALAANPKLLLLDEPSLGLAPMIVLQIFEIIARINRERKTSILLVEQNANLALKTSRRGYVMESGAIRTSGESARLLGDSEIQKAYLGIG